MDTRERFKKICRFERPNDPMLAVYGVSSWYETYFRWIDEGLPVKDKSLPDLKNINLHLLGYENQNESIEPSGSIGGVGPYGTTPWISAIDPRYEVKIISESSDKVVQVDPDGAIVERKKHEDFTIPRFIEYPVKDRKTWKEYKKRLDPFSPGRWPEGWEIMTDDKLQFPIKKEHEGKHWKHRDFLLGMNLMSLFGNPRSYMGIENLSYAIFEDIGLVEDMIETQFYLADEMAKKIFKAGVDLDWVQQYEDMCYKNGSLVSPKFVKKFMAPRYKKNSELLRKNGVELIVMDCDGNVDELLPIWIECGINGIYPLECAADMDAKKIRKKYGKNVIIVGNIDKRALAAGKKEIDEELDKAKTLLEFGGYFPCADHEIPPDVSYRNIVYFLNGLAKLSDYEDTRRFINT